LKQRSAAGEFNQWLIAKSLVNNVSSVTQFMEKEEKSVSIRNCLKNDVFLSVTVHDKPSSIMETFP